MPVVNLNGNECYYRLDGREDLPTLVLSHSLGLDHGMWDQQTLDLLPHMRVLRYDIRGHGASAVPRGDYTIEQLARDVLALTAALDVEQFAFCGLSLGGMIGQWLGANAGDRLTHLVLANTSPRLTDPQGMETRRQTVLDSGMIAIVDMVMGRFFSPGPLERNPPAIASARRTLLSTHPIGYAGCCAAIRDMDQRRILTLIKTPTLVISGDGDVGMPWPDHGELLTQSIEGARAVRLPAAHISNLERPRSFSSALMEFLVATPSDALQSGASLRRAVLGDAYVDRSIAEMTDFTRDFRELVTRYAWGTVWSRPGLDHRSRRLLTLTTAAALARWEEFRLHVRSGLASDLEPCDLEEVLMQLSVYAGVPAANTAFAIASEELAGPR